jgi:hypothetical protein
MTAMSEAGADQSLDAAAQTSFDTEAAARLRCTIGRLAAAILLEALPAFEELTDAIRPPTRPVADAQ